MEKMSITKFLSRYYGVNNSNICNLTHQDVKILFPEIKRCSFNYANKNFEEIVKGNIILVEDRRGNIAPYFVFQCEYDVYEEIFDFDSKENDEKILDVTSEELAEFSKWQLIQSLKECRNCPYMRKKICREMQDRGMKQRDKRRDYNDKYERKQYVKCLKP